MNPEWLLTYISIQILQCYKISPIHTQRLPAYAACADAESALAKPISVSIA
jgi:hypothetical protein